MQNTTPLRELDRRVAVALGWQEIIAERHGEEVQYYGYPPGDPPAGRHYTHNYALPRYSADLNRAFECVDFMAEKYGLRSCNGFHLHRKDEEGREPYFYCEFGDPTWEGAEGKTASEAICRAFLASLPTEGHQE